HLWLISRAYSPCGMKPTNTVENIPRPSLVAPKILFTFGVPRSRLQVMALRESPPFRADHVGSLLRPAKLLQAREDHASGRIDDAAVRAAEDEAIREVVKLQREAGLRTATDGEFRRASWHMDFSYSLEGISKAPGELQVKFRNPKGEIRFTPAAMKVDGKLGVAQT